MVRPHQRPLGPVREAFRATGLTESSTVAETFHAVRKIPYGSGGGRTIRSVLTLNMGSCSGKHVLLRDLLRVQGRSATIETVSGDFAAAIPPLKSMSDALKQMCRTGGIRDFHHFVVLENPDGNVRLDATWSDAPIIEGIVGNRDWDGEGDTKLAVEPEAVLDRVEDIPAYKAQLLANLPPDMQKRRLNFLSLLSDWTARIEKRGR